MQSLIGEEMKNVRTAIPLAEQDSRLGYEPSMDYVCDAGHLNWKLRQLEKLRDKTLPAYAESIGLRPEM